MNVPRHGQPYLAHDFVRQVAEREGVPEEEARWFAVSQSACRTSTRRTPERAARAALVTLREAVSEKELRDMFSQLPEDMRRLFSPLAA